MKDIYGQFVHEFVDAQGVTRYAVWEWDQEAGQYKRPVDQRVYKLTGCSHEFTRKLEPFGGYLTRREALRRARYLWGDENEVVQNS